MKLGLLQTLRHRGLQAVEGYRRSVLLRVHDDGGLLWREGRDGRAAQVRFQVRPNGLRAHWLPGPADVLETMLKNSLFAVHWTV